MTKESTVDKKNIFDHSTTSSLTNQNIFVCLRIVVNERAPRISATHVFKFTKHIFYQLCSKHLVGFVFLSIHLKCDLIYLRESRAILRTSSIQIIFFSLLFTSKSTIFRWGDCRLLILGAAVLPQPAAQVSFPSKLSLGSGRHTLPTIYK